jgi:DNA-binding MarR family transcriptional regulator
MSEEALLERWRDLVTTHAVVRESLERALERNHQLSLSEYEVLRQLSAAPEGHLRMQELAEEIHLSQSALSRSATTTAGECGRALPTAAVPRRRRRSRPTWPR